MPSPSNYLDRVPVFFHILGNNLCDDGCNKENERSGNNSGDDVRRTSLIGSIKFSLGKRSFRAVLLPMFENEPTSWRKVIPEWN